MWTCKEWCSQSVGLETPCKQSKGGEESARCSEMEDWSCNQHGLGKGIDSMGVSYWPMILFCTTALPGLIKDCPGMILRDIFPFITLQVMSLVPYQVYFWERIDMNWPTPAPVWCVFWVNSTTHVFNLKLLYSMFWSPKTVASPCGQGFTHSTMENFSLERNYPLTA